MRFLCNVSLLLKVPKFRVATALQHCKLPVRQNWRIGGFLPALVR